MKISALRITLGAALAIFLSLNAVAQTQLGKIKSARVEGDVQKVLKNGTSAALKNGDELFESETVKTGKGSSIVLVFENGSSVKLGADSSLAIDEFKIDPLLSAPVDLSSLKAEPTVSKTSLNLAYGEMVGDVKKLNIEKGSSYSIRTPVGAAGIRGTIFRIVFRPDSTGKAFFTVSTAEGLVVMTGVTTQTIPIGKGKEVVVTIDIPNTTPAPGTPPPAPVIVKQDIPAATATLITAAATSISQVLQTTTFTPPSAPTPEPPKPEEKKKEEPKPETPPPTPPPASTPPPTPPPANTPITPQLTPGAGK